MKTGLVLEGGALRGLFSAGVMDELMEQGVTFDGAIGVSAGAGFGCNYKSCQPGRALRYVKRYCRDWRFCSIKSLVKTGDLFGAEFDYHTLPDQLDPFDNATYNRNPMAFYVVCTDLTTGRPVYKRLDQADYACYEWIRASASMPIASRVVSIEGRKLLDGGMSDSIPLRFFQQQGYVHNLVVLTQPRNYVKTHNPLMPLIRIWLRHYPAAIKAMEQRPQAYNDEIAFVRAEEQAGRALVICPDHTLPISHICHDPEVIQATYDIGRHVAHERLAEIKQFMSGADIK